jgi:outer membrane protein TolC
MTAPTHHHDHHRQTASTRLVTLRSSNHLSSAFEQTPHPTQVFATHKPLRDSKLNVIVANLTQSLISIRRMRLSTGPLRRSSILAALIAVLSIAPVTLASAQQNAALPMAPSAMVAAALSSPRPAAHPRFDLQSADVSTIRFAGDIGVEQATAGPLALGLDDAIDRGTRQNLQVLLANQANLAVRGQILSAIYELMPNLKVVAYTNTLQLNLAAMGFKPSSLANFGLPPNAIHTIVKVDTTSAQLTADQVLFNLPYFYLYAAAKKAQNVVTMNLLNVRGQVVEAVGTQYLAALADQAQIANHQALLTADNEVLRQATLSHDAGVGINLDVLRARVQLQTEQQALISAQNTFAKDKIALNRLIGLPADQELTLTDTVPYAELTELPLDQARTIAYQRRKDLLALQAEQQVAVRARKAVKFERMPTLAVNGYYGVLGETQGLYHGVFTAQGVLKIPISEEARFHGESEMEAAQAAGLARQIESLRITIDAQIRASMLDVDSSAELVKVARSNVDLASQALSDARDRFTAGVDDNLPVVQAQATLEQTQGRLVATEFQFNQAKLTLARNTGVVETQYKHYLGR